MLPDLRAVGASCAPPSTTLAFFVVLAACGDPTHTTDDERDASVTLHDDAATIDVTPCDDDACRPASLALTEGASCARMVDGSVWCWGLRSRGELGDGATCDDPDACVALPMRVALERPARKIVASGGPGACAIDDEGNVACWGLDALASRGAPTVVPAPASGDALSGARAIAQGVWLRCAIGEDHVARCQGANELGQLGRGALGMPQLDLAPVLDELNAPLVASSVAIGIGAAFACATIDGGVRCWGAADSGATGWETYGLMRCGVPSAEVHCAPRARPIQAIEHLDTRALALGAGHACALLEAGSVWCWGEGRSAQLARPERVSSPAAAAVQGLAQVTAIAAGRAHSCALDVDRRVWCWGANDLGQLGDGVAEHPGERCAADGASFDCSAKPVAVVGLDDALTIAAGRDHTCAIRAGGEVVCWGDGRTMQLGDGGRVPRNEPVRVIGL